MREMLYRAFPGTINCSLSPENCSLSNSGINFPPGRGHGLYFLRHETSLDKDCSLCFLFRSRLRSIGKLYRGNGGFAPPAQNPPPFLGSPPLPPRPPNSHLGGATIKNEAPLCGRS